MATLAQQRAAGQATAGSALADTGQQFMQFLLALMQQQEAKADRAQDRAMQQLQMQSLMQAMRQRSESGPTEQLLRELQLLTGRQELQQSEKMQPARQRLLEAQATSAETSAQLAPEELALKRSQLELAYQRLAAERDIAPLERALRQQALDLQAEELGITRELLPFKTASIKAGTALTEAQLQAASRENRVAERLTGPRTDFELAKLAADTRLLPLQEDVTRASGEDELSRLQNEPARRETADATARAGARAATANATIAEADAATAPQRAQQAVTAGELQIEQGKLNNALARLEAELGPEKAEMLREQIIAARAGNARALIETVEFQREFFDGSIEKRKAIADATSELQLSLGQISLEEAKARSKFFDELIEAELALKQAQAEEASARAAGTPDPAVTAELTSRQLALQEKELALKEKIFARGGGAEGSQASSALLGAEGQAITLASGAQGTLGTAFSEPENDAVMAIMGLPGIGAMQAGEIPTALHRAIDPTDPADAQAAQNETVLQIANDYLNASDGLIENVILNYKSTMGDSGVLDVEKMVRESQRGGLLKLLRVGKLSVDSPAMLEALAALRMGTAFNDELHPVMNELANSQKVSRYIAKMPPEKRARLFSNQMENLGFQARALETAVPDQKLQEQYFKIVNHRQVSRAFKDVVKLSLIEAANDPEAASRLNTLLKDWTPSHIGVGASISAVGTHGISGPLSIPMAQPRGTARGQDSEFLRGFIGDELYATDAARGHGFFGGNDVTLDGQRYGNANEALAAGYLLDKLSPVENANTPRERFVSRQPQYGGDYRYRIGGERAQDTFEQRLRDNPTLPIEELFANRPPPGEYLPVNPMLPVPVGMQAPAPEPGFGTTVTGYSPQPFDDQMAMLQAMYNQPPPAPQQMPVQLMPVPGASVGAIPMMPPPAPAMPAPQQMPVQLMPVPGAPVGAIPMMAPVDPMEQLRMILNPYSSPVP